MNINRQRIKAILSLAIPITAGMGSQNLLNLVDIAMLGRLGKEEVAAVGLCAMVIWVLSSLMQGFSPAIQTITARRLGEKKLNHLHDATVNAFFLIILVGVPATFILESLAPEIMMMLNEDEGLRAIGTDYLSIRLLTLVFIGFNFCFRGYFNGLKKATVYMSTLVTMHLLNLVLNYTLIFGRWGFPEMGVKGAALGTAIATAMGSLVFFVLMMKHRQVGSNLSIRLVSLPIIRTVLRLGLPSCAQNLAMASGFLFFFHIAGSISTNALAATNILINLNLVCVLIALGLGLSTITLVSNALGKKDKLEAIAWVKGTLILAVGILTILGGVLAVFPKFWLGLFLPDAPEIAAITTLPLILLGISQIYDGAGIVLSYAHLGGGASRTVMVISIVNQWCLFLPACYIWVHYFSGSLLHLWICMVTYRFIQFLCYCYSTNAGHWLNIKV